jgi:hypothetical protein
MRLAVGGCSHRGLGKNPSSKLRVWASFQESSRRGSGSDRSELSALVPRRLVRVATVLADAVGCKIVLSAASEARLVIQLDAVRPFGSPAFAAPILLDGMADKIVVAM